MLPTSKGHWSHAYDWPGLVSFQHLQSPAKCYSDPHVSILTPCLFEQGEADDKIIAVCADDPEYKHYNDIKELPPHRLAEIRRFFEDCILFYQLNIKFCILNEF